MSNNQNKSQIEKNNSDKEVLMEIRDVSVTFEMERGKSRVLDEADLDIRKGEILGVVGESGSGKSMFASALLDAVEEPGNLTGEIIYHSKGGSGKKLLSLDDEELRQVRWEEIAMVFQGSQSSWNPTMTIRGHFEETIKHHTHSKEEGMARARELLADLYLDPNRILDSYPHELSGGMQQRALIALSLVLEPDLLVMDEPTAALDLLMQRSIIALLDKLKKKYRLTMVFITHDIELVANLSDRLAVMYAFEMVEIGESKDVLLKSKHPYTRSLVNSIPNLRTPVNEMQPIPGESPDPVAIPEGCSYHPRCKLSDEKCKNENPGMYHTGSDRTAACHYWERVDEKIPLNISQNHE